MNSMLKQELFNAMYENARQAVYIPFAREELMHILLPWYESEWSYGEIESMAWYWDLIRQWIDGDQEYSFSEYGEEYFYKHWKYDFKKMWWKAFNWFEKKLAEGPEITFYEDALNEQLYFIG